MVKTYMHLYRHAAFKQKTQFPSFVVRRTVKEHRVQWEDKNTFWLFNF